MTPTSDSIAALSQGDDIEPIDGSIPASRMVFPKQQRGVLRPVVAVVHAALAGPSCALWPILSASSASSAAMLADIDQPTIILDHTSITTGQVEPSLASPHVGDVREPQPVRPRPR